MKKSEYQQMVNDISTEVLQKNTERIQNQVSASIERQSQDGKISHSEAALALSATFMSLAPRISAEITAEMLVRLGLVTVEDDD